jgi:hypothetical protein
MFASVIYCCVTNHHTAQGLTQLLDCITPALDSGVSNGTENQQVDFLLLISGVIHEARTQVQGDMTIGGPLSFSPFPGPYTTFSERS